MSSRPEAGAAPRPLRVIDIAQGWAGPMVSFLLAELGAEVIKVEGCRRFDWWRGPHPRDAARAPDGSIVPNAHEMAAVFNTVNRHKQGVTLELTTEAGRAALLDLVRISDLIVENFTPHAMAGLGLEYAVLAEVNPQIVMLSMPGFGSTGPEREYIGYGMTMESLGGMTALTGYADGGPQMMSNAYGDPVSGLNGAVAALIALHGRERRGRGCWVEVAQVESFIPLIAGALLDAQMNGRDGARRGNRHPSIAPHGAYPTSDPAAWLTLSAGTDVQWAALCCAIGRPELARDPRFAGVVERKHHEDELDALIGAWTSERTREQALDALHAASVPAAPVQSSADLLADPRLAARDFFTVVERAHVGTHPYPALPFHLTPQPSLDPSPAPCLGEHSESVLAALLGVTPEQYAALVAAGVSGTQPLP